MDDGVEALDLHVADVDPGDPVARRVQITSKRDAAAAPQIENPSELLVIIGHDYSAMRRATAGRMRAACWAGAAVAAREAIIATTSRTAICVHGMTKATS